MFELIAMSILGVSYVGALAKEKQEEIEQKKKEIIRDLKIKVFCYAVRHKMLYNDVVEMLRNKQLTFEDIEADREATK